MDASADASISQDAQNVPLRLCRMGKARAANSRNAAGQSEQATAQYITVAQCAQFAHWQRRIPTVTALRKAVERIRSSRDRGLVSCAFVVRPVGEFEAIFPAIIAIVIRIESRRPFHEIEESTARQVVEAN